MNQEKLLYLLLDIVERNGDIRQLAIKGNLNFKEVGDLVNLALKEKYLEAENEMISLTLIGKAKMEKDWAEYKRTNKEEWILPDERSRIRKISKNDIFLPRQDELTF